MGPYYQNGSGRGVFFYQKPTDEVYFDERRLKGGLPYFGLFVDGQLVSIVGTHGLVPDIGIAAIGDAFTHPNYRRKKYATQVTHQLLKYLKDTYGTKFVGTDIRADKPGHIFLTNNGFTQWQIQKQRNRWEDQLIYYQEAQKSSL